MNVIDLNKPGSNSLVLPGLVGSVEAHCTVPQSPRKKIITLCGHPHSLHGGTMDNKVVTTLTKAFVSQGISVLRVNFRGVGQSEGEFDSGIGESEDCLHFLAKIKESYPDYQIVLAGFSFGAYVTYRVAAQMSPALLISIAPAVNHGDFNAFAKIPAPWHVVVAGKDEVVPKRDVLTWAERVSPKPTLKIFADSSHFFHGQLVMLREYIESVVIESLNG